MTEAGDGIGFARLAHTAEVDENVYADSKTQRFSGVAYDLI